ncbi:hypothetical protein CBER1_09784 [Cercospora berteroae]|uniref:AA1-like domain-containing protein n=1 Tax=Cercospora berteroae TaxID=357750 RepID=A0A2S6BY44_9PEZI|nr:hypothetical protein CBER1_09784 [Cercospora berteroae]
MHFSTISFTALVTFLSITSSSAQQLFQIFPFQAQDISIPTESHSVKFNISRPGAVPQQGGDGTHTCEIAWNGCDAPTCYQLCTSVFELGYHNSDYWARVTPGSEKKKAGDLSIDILEYYSYRNSVVQNATFAIKDGETPGYACETGEGRKSCALNNEEIPVQTEVEVSGYGIYPVSSVVEVCGES